MLQEGPEGRRHRTPTDTPELTSRPAPALDLTLRRSALDPWLGVVLRAGTMIGLGLGAALAGVALSVVAIALDVVDLLYLLPTGLCSLSCPMMVLPLFAFAFLELGGRRLLIEGAEVRLLRTDGPELARASTESVRASVKKGVYEAWGQRGRVLHLGVGAKPIAIGARDDAQAHAMRSAGWPAASPPELECTPAELDALMRALGLDPVA